MAILVVAGLTGILLAELRFDISATSRSLVIGYFLFNFGYFYSGAKDRSKTLGARVGVAAVMLNILPVLLSEWESIWLALSVPSVALGLAAAVCLLRDARRART